jgi:hypothetical protein
VLPQFFYESMQGAPAGNRASQGNTIAILDACLVNGFNLQTGVALSRVGQLVTAAKTAHGYIDWQLITIAGATQTDYNGIFRIRRLDANSFTYTLSGALTPTTPATGTISALTTPLGWAKVFSATNKAVYRAPSGATRHYIRFDATNTSSDETLWVECFKSMTSVTAGTDLYPTTGRGGGAIAGDRSRHLKPYTKALSTDVGWALVGDDRRFGWMPAQFTSRRCPLWFGEFKSYLPSDVNNSLLAGSAFAFGANIDNAGTIYGQSIVFPYVADAPVPNDSGNFNSAPYSLILAGNPSNSIKSIKAGVTEITRSLASDTDGHFGASFGDPYSTNDVILSAPLIFELPTQAATVLALRGKLPFILQTAHKIDCITLGGNERIFVSQNVPVYGQVLNIAWNISGTGASGIGSYAIPLGDWELL